MRVPFLHRLILLAVLLAAIPFAGSAEDAPSQILFVHLRMKDGAVSLVGATNVPGMLKSRRGTPPHQDFQLVLEDASGKELWSDGIADPSVQRFEYEDPAQPGVIQRKEVRLPETEFTVRVPARPGRRHLAIYRHATVPAAPALRQSQPARELVTRVALPAEAAP